MGGTVAACGDNRVGQCNIPALDAGLTYTQFAAGDFHSLLLKSDGTVVTCGDNCDGQCNIPGLDEGLTYTQVAAGNSHSLLLESDGTVATCGYNCVGQCNVPALADGVTFAQNGGSCRGRVIMQACYEGGVIYFLWLSGEKAWE